MNTKTLQINAFCARLFGRFFYALPLCFAAGLLSSLSMAPANIWGTLFIALPVLYLALYYNPTKRRAFFCGWLFGFGYFLLSLHWIGNALLVEGNPYKWAWPLAISGLPAVLALYPAFAALIIYRFTALTSVSGWLGFASIYALCEWLRGHLFTGFPWNLFGYAWADIPEMLQVLWLSDVYFLTWLTLLWASMPALLMLGNHQSRLIGMCLSCGTLLAVLAYGIWQYPPPQANKFRDDIKIRIVQPNIDQVDKWKSDLQLVNFRKHLQLSYNTNADNKPTLIIWPETAVSYQLLDDPRAIKEITDMLESYPQNVALITGMLRRDPETGAFANAMVMIGKDGVITNIYNKHHLVPFGEYIPFQRWIPLRPIVEFTGFEKGDGLHAFEALGFINYSPLVCYEIIFPGRSMANQSPAAEAIINITNDAWYGYSAGPYQHLTQALYRAVENGVPAVRSANTGFSGILTPYGEIIGQSALFKDWSREFLLPKTKFLPNNFQHYKFLFFLITATVCFVAAIVHKKLM